MPFPDVGLLSRRRAGARRADRCPPFQAEAALRPLVVCVDADTVLAGVDPRTDFALRLLERGGARVSRYADEGPPGVGSPPPFVVPGWRGVPGWLVFEPADGDDARGGSAGSVRWADEDGAVGVSGVFGGDLLRLAADRGASLYAGAADPGGAAGRDALAGMVAEAVGADVMITSRPLLLDPPVPVLRETVALAPAGATAVAGLHLRLQGRFLMEAAADGSAPFTCNRGHFYWVAARALLPSGRLWMSACVRSSTGDDSLSWLAGTLHQRVASALKARDRVLAALLVPQDNDTADDALEALDVLLVCLMGAFDVSASVAQAVLGLPANGHAQWQLDGFVRSVAEGAPGLAALMAKDTDSRAVVTVLRLLRNTVHGEALPSLAVMAGGTRLVQETLVGLPRRRRDELAAAMDRLGGPESWGVRMRYPDRVHADIRVLIERLLPAVTDLLDRVLAATPVERLPGLDAARLTDGPPVDEARDAFTWSAPVLERVLWQLGLEPPPGSF